MCDCDTIIKDRTQPYSVMIIVDLLFVPFCTMLYISYP